MLIGLLILFPYTPNTDSVQTLARLGKVENFLAVYWKNLNHSQQFSDVNVNMSSDPAQMRHSWFELSVRHYEQALNILQKKQQTMNFKHLRHKQQEQVRTMLFRVMCEMSNALCEWSIALHSDTQTSPSPSVLYDRKVQSLCHSSPISGSK